jgi:hypothetical protein
MGSELIRLIPGYTKVTEKADMHSSPVTQIERQIKNPGLEYSDAILESADELVFSLLECVFPAADCVGASYAEALPGSDFFAHLSCP